MRILFVSHSAELAGAELSLLKLVNEAAARGHSGLIAIPAPGPLAARFVDVAHSFPVVVQPTHWWMGRRFYFPIGTLRLIQALWDVWGHLRLLRMGRFDVVIVNSSVIPAPLLASRLARIPVMLIVRESLMSNPTLRSALPRRLLRSVLAKAADTILTVSNFVSQQFKFANTVVYPQLDQKFLDNVPKSVEWRRDAKRPLTAVMLGTINSEKGQLDAVKAVKIALDHGASIKLNLYGRGPASEVQLLKRTIEALGLSAHVILKDFIDDPIAVYQQADISIVCSKNEAFGKVTAESVLAGTPVVAYNCGGTAEILAYGGGILSEPSAEGLASVLHVLYEDPSRLRSLQQQASKSDIRLLLRDTPAKVIDEAEVLLQRQAGSASSTDLT